MCWCWNSRVTQNAIVVGKENQEQPRKNVLLLSFNKKKSYTTVTTKAQPKVDGNLCAPDSARVQVFCMRRSSWYSLEGKKNTLYFSTFLEEIEWKPIYCNAKFWFILYNKSQINSKVHLSVWLGWFFGRKEGKIWLVLKLTEFWKLSRRLWLLPNILKVLISDLYFSRYVWAKIVFYSFLSLL